jgi:K+-transporting ATPase ATPase C chain
MRQHTLISIRITFALLVITCGLYPLVVWGIGQAAFRDGANGSLITRNGRVIGSALIAQNFTGDQYFHPRPSAAGSDGYDPSASGGTNWGMTSRKLLDAITARTTKYSEVKPAGGIPADAVTASCSGVDPEISPANAYAQAPRVAKANGVPLARITALIERYTAGRFGGLFGEPRVNVLRLNLALDSRVRGLRDSLSERSRGGAENAENAEMEAEPSSPPTPPRLRVNRPPHLATKGLHEAVRR